MGQRTLAPCSTLPALPKEPSSSAPKGRGSLPAVRPPGEDLTHPTLALGCSHFPESADALCGVPRLHCCRSAPILLHLCCSLLTVHSRSREVPPQK